VSRAGFVRYAPGVGLLSASEDGRIGVWIPEDSEPLKHLIEAWQGA
jgi:hypothetical protein